MEAETYLSRGFSLREAIETQPNGWKPFGDLARVEQPGRLKGILVSPEYGIPFLAATQVFDVRQSHASSSRSTKWKLRRIALSMTVQYL